MKKICLILFLSFLHLHIHAQKNDSCDKSVYYSLINKHIHYIDKESGKEKYFILNKITGDTLKKYKNFPTAFCFSSTLLDSNLLKMQDGMVVDNFDPVNIPLYTFSQVNTNVATNEYYLRVSVSTGEWGGSTVSYVYKKKKKRWKLVKKHVLSVS